jgi:hypothetical protein
LDESGRRNKFKQMREFCMTVLAILTGLVVSCGASVGPEDYVALAYKEFSACRTMDSTCNVVLVTYEEYEPNSWRYSLQKYDSSGRLRWRKLGSGLQELTDFSAFIADDADDNVYVAESVFVREPNEPYSVAMTVFGAVLRKYSPEGKLLWKIGPAEVGLDSVMLVVGPEGQVLTGGTCGTESTDEPNLAHAYKLLRTDVVLNSYDGSGKFLWSARYGSEDKDEVPAAIVFDREGNVYVLVGTGKGGAVLKYDRLGRLIWARDHRPVEGAVNGVRFAAVADTNALYVIGTSFWSEPRKMEVVTTKYNASGNMEWVKRCGRDDSNVAAVSGIITDAHGGVYICGNFARDRPYIRCGQLHSASTKVDVISNKEGATSCFVVAKYSGTGEQEWIAVHEQLSSQGGWVSELVLDKDDNVYLVGRIEARAFIIKLGPDGTEQWKKLFREPSDFYGNLSALCRQ